MTTGKRSISVDLARSPAEVLGDLVRWADVVIDSFSPRAAWLGLDYDGSGSSPDLIMCELPVRPDRPAAPCAGYGTMGAALSGFFDLAGWPDRPPAGRSGPTATTRRRSRASALLAALDHRGTGEGQYLDFAQTEACTHFLAPALLDHAVNGHEWTRNGNADPEMAPHGVYPPRRRAVGRRGLPRRRRLAAWPADRSARAGVTRDR